MGVATERAFEDMNRLIGRINRLKSDAEELKRNIVELDGIVAEVLDGAERQDDLKKVLDVHPIYNVTKIKAEVASLKALGEKI